VPIEGRPAPAVVDLGVSTLFAKRILPIRDDFPLFRPIPRLALTKFAAAWLFRRTGTRKAGPAARLFNFR